MSQNKTVFSKTVFYPKDKNWAVWLYTQTDPRWMKTQALAYYAIIKL